jgi:hypothetical protein
MATPMNLALDLNVRGQIDALEIKADTITAANFVQTGSGTQTYASLNLTGTLSVDGTTTLEDLDANGTTTMATATVTNLLTAGSVTAGTITGTSLATSGIGTLTVANGVSTLSDAAVGTLNVTGVSTLAQATVTNALSAGSLATTGSGTLTVANGLTSLSDLTVSNHVATTTLESSGLVTLESAYVTNSTSTDTLVVRTSTTAATLEVTGAANFTLLPLSSGDIASPAATALVTRTYVDTEINDKMQGLHPHAPVVAATTGNIATFPFVGYGPIDGINLAAGDRVLVKNQGTKVQEGIYITGATSGDTWAAAIVGDITNAYVFVLGGTVNNDSSWVQTVTGDQGVIQQNWIQFSVVVPQIVNLGTTTTSSNIIVTNTVGTNASIDSATLSAAGVLSAAQTRRVVDIQLLYSGTPTGGGAPTPIFAIFAAGVTDTIMVKLLGMSYAVSTGEVIATDTWGVLNIIAGECTWVQALGASSVESVIGNTASNSFNFDIENPSNAVRTGYYTLTMFSLKTGDPFYPIGAWHTGDVTEL